MDHEVSAVESLDRLIWAVIVLVAAFVVTALLLSNFHLAWQTFAAPALACSTLLAGGWFYSRWRADARLASGLFSTAQLIAFAAVAAPFSYIAASVNLPLCDAALDTMDRALGFETAALWPVRYLRWAAVILNTAMLIATPIDGSHYFSDVLAGVVLAALSLLIAQIVVARVRAHPQRRGGSSRRAHAASSRSPAGDQLARAPFVPFDARQRR
jgi:uncharacterized membrane protein